MKRMIKKIIVSVLVTALIATFAGCHNNIESNTSDGDSSINTSQNAESDMGWNITSVPEIDIDGFFYEINADGQTVTITGSKKSTGNVSVPKTIDKYTVTSIGAYAFFQTKLTGITLPESIETIGSGAFYGCSELKNVSISSGLTSIGSFAFAECTGLKSINIPESTLNIDRFAFMNCSELAEITILNMKDAFNKSAFWGCPNPPMKYDGCFKAVSLNRNTMEVPDGYTYSDWVTESSFESETPVETTADDMTRIVSDGYYFKLDEGNKSKITYKYIIQKRDKELKFKTLTTTTYDYTITVEEDNEIVDKIYYNQSSIPEESAVFKGDETNGSDKELEDDTIIITDSNRIERPDLDELMKQLDDLYINGKLVLKEGEEPILTPVGISDITPNGAFRYGSWHTSDFLTSDHPISSISEFTFRILSGGYSYVTTENGTSLVYKYFFQERCKYYNTSAVKIIVDDNGSRQWLNTDGDVVLSDNDYTEWNDVETILSETPEEIYEKELERVISSEYEVVTDANGKVNIIYHYLRQTRQHK